MRWLLHGSLAPAVADTLREHGHSASTAQDAELAADAPPDDVLEAARVKQLDLLTNDAALISHAVERGTDLGRSLVFLQVQGGEVEQADAVDRLFERYKRLTPGRLYTVTGSRVKIRQLPQPKP